MSTDTENASTEHTFIIPYDDSGPVWVAQPDISTHSVHVLRCLQLQSKGFVWFKHIITDDRYQEGHAGGEGWEGHRE